MDRLRSETMVVAAPMSFAGSAQRWTNLLWRHRREGFRRWVGWWLRPIAIVTTWGFVALWYSVWLGLIGWWMVSYRLLRRSQRTNKVLTQRHAEVLDAIAANRTLPADETAPAERFWQAPKASAPGQLPQLPPPPLRGDALQLGPGPTGPRFGSRSPF